MYKANEGEFDIIDASLVRTFEEEILDLSEIERLQKNVFNFDKKGELNLFKFYSFLSSVI